MSKKKKSRFYKKKSHSLEETLQELLFEKNTPPLTLEELAHQCKAPKAKLGELRSILENWIKLGKIKLVRQRYSRNVYPKESFVAKLRIHPKGFGFAQIYNETQKTFVDLFIAKENLHSGCDGDTVRLILPTPKFPDRGPEGLVVEIISRGRSELAGTVYITEPAVFVQCPSMGAEKKIKVVGKNMKKLSIGDHVLVNITEWDDDLLTTELISIVGNIKNASQDGDLAKLAFGIPFKFPEECSFEGDLPAEEIKNRKDLRKWECVTIDPATAKDFDDAISLTKEADGSYMLGVHIADVSHYVVPDSSLDHEASARCNSTYLPGECIPMLPESLSNGLCSLKPNTNRLTISALIHLSDAGDLIDYTIDRTVIRSKKRFTYEEAKQVLDGTLPSEHTELLNRMMELCHKLKDKRRRRGSIDFALPELVVQLDKNGEPTGVRVIPYDITHQMIEEFMLKANEIVALYLTQNNKPVLYRIHEPPNRSVLNDFVQLCRSFGEKLPDDPVPTDIQALFERIKGSSFCLQVSTAFIRTMKIAYYSPENSGHYGLSLDHYCHFTSPIRRYADLIIERSLFDGKIDTETLPRIAMHCSEKERNSMRAENHVKLLKKIRLLLQWQQNAKISYDAIITKVRPFGIFFDIIDISLEGFLHVSELGHEYFLFDPKRNRFQGEKSGRSFAVGQSIKVELIDADLIFLQTEWKLLKST